MIHEEHVLAIAAPPGSRFKGYQDIIVQDLRPEPRLIRCRRARWRTPEGRTLVAALPAGVRGHFGPELRRFVLAQHQHRGAGHGRADRRVPERARGDHLQAPGGAAPDGPRRGLRRRGRGGPAGRRLETARWIAADDTGARHRAKNGVTTQIGSDHFTPFATGLAKSRRNFLEVPRTGHGDYAVNDAALAHMRDHGLAGPVIAALAAHPTRHFADRASWRAHPEALGLTRLAVTPDPVKIATEAALWGAIRGRGRGLLEDTVIVSDDAGQFRLGRHALRWVRAERLVHKLIPRNEPQRRAVELIRQLIRWFYADLKAYRRDPCHRRRAQLRARFDRIFRRRTGFATLDRLLARLHARKDLHARKEEPPLVLERPESPPHTNGSGHDLRCHVTRRKISGGTWSEAGRDARDAGLGLLKTCRKLGLSFLDYLGARRSACRQLPSSRPCLSLSGPAPLPDRPGFGPAYRRLR